MNRKIELNTDTFCPASGWSEFGDKDCDHDYKPKPEAEYDTYAYWRCTKCGMRRYYEVWN